MKTAGQFNQEMHSFVSIRMYPWPEQSSGLGSGVGVDLQCSRHFDTPCSNRRTAANLNSFVDCLRDNPMTQFSIQWNLVLTKGGNSSPMARAG
jgi:hypothetical protein